MRLLDWAVDWWLRKCPHDGRNVVADLLEGDGPTQVKYCRRCGAVKREFDHDWRRPRPLWHGPNGRHSCRKGRDNDTHRARIIEASVAQITALWKAAHAAMMAEKGETK